MGWIKRFKPICTSLHLTTFPFLKKIVSSALILLSNYLITREGFAYIVMRYPNMGINLFFSLLPVFNLCCEYLDLMHHQFHSINNHQNLQRKARSSTSTLFLHSRQRGCFFKIYLWLPPSKATTWVFFQQFPFNLFVCFWTPESRSHAIFIGKYP